MPYLTHGLITASDRGTLGRTGDFNGFLTNANNVYGVGTGDRGYGQTTIVQPNVTTGSIVYASQWVNLLNMLIICSLQQGSDISNLPPGTVYAPGQIITAYNGGTVTTFLFETDLNGADQALGGTTTTGGTSLSSYVTQIDTNRLAVSLTALSTVTNVWSSSQPTTWTNSITTEVSAIWPTENAARYFFNSGGQIDLHGSHPTGTSQDNLWHATFATGLGTLGFAAYATANSGTITGSQALGYYNLTDVYQMIYTDNVVSGAAAYAGGVGIVISAKRLLFAGVNGGNGRGVQFQVVYTETSGFTATTLAAGTAMAFDNVVATTFLTGILTPTYATVTAFSGAPPDNLFRVNLNGANQALGGLP